MRSRETRIRNAATLAAAAPASGTIAPAAIAAAGTRTAPVAHAAHVECQHPVMTGVDVFRLHGNSTRAACAFALDPLHLAP